MEKGARTLCSSRRRPMGHGADAGTISTRRCCATRGYEQNLAKDWTWHRAAARYRTGKTSNAGAKKTQARAQTDHGKNGASQVAGHQKKKKKDIISSPHLPRLGRLVRDDRHQAVLLPLLRRRRIPVRRSPRRQRRLRACALCFLLLRAVHGGCRASVLGGRCELDVWEVVGTVAVAIDVVARGSTR